MRPDRCYQESFLYNRRILVVALKFYTFEVCLMRAMLLSKPAPIETAPLQPTNVEVPEPTADQVLVKVKTCGVCRTDLHIVEGELPPHKLPIIPGHQIVGTAERSGSACSRVCVGERVGVAWLRKTCGHCAFCAAGKENLCPSSLYTGYDEDGGYAEYALVPESFLYRIPNSFDDVSAAPLLCAGIIGYRALQRCNLPAHGILALYGFGASAHIVFQIARHRGHKLFVVSQGARHQEAARELGADWVGAEPAEMPERPDAGIIFAPAGRLVLPALEFLKKGGTLVLAGIYMSDIPPMNYERHLFYERDIRTVTANTREDAQGLLLEAARIPVRVRTCLYSLEDANQALLDLKMGKIQGSAVLQVSPT